MGCGRSEFFQKHSMQAKSPLRLLAEISENPVHLSPAYRSLAIREPLRGGAQGTRHGPSVGSPARTSRIQAPTELLTSNRTIMKMMVLWLPSNLTYQGMVFHATATLTISPWSRPFLTFLRFRTDLYSIILCTSSPENIPDFLRLTLSRSTRSPLCPESCPH